MTSWKTITWDAARAAGLTSYLLLTVTVVLGLVLSLRWQSKRWPRLVTNEAHGYLALLSLVFLTVHVLAVAVDPFTRFGLADVVVPFYARYRPLWMGLGIASLYLLLAVLLSSWLRSRIGFRTWRRLHFATFAVYAGATLHGLGTGSDTRSPAALALYVASVGVVGVLVLVRLLAPVARDARPRPLPAGVVIGALVLLAGWTLTGPLASGWGARAGGAVTHRVTLAPPAVQTVTSPAAAQASGRVSGAFAADFQGRVTISQLDASGRITVRIDGALHGPSQDHLEILLHGPPAPGGGIEMERSRVRMGLATALYVGQVVALQGNRLEASLSGASQQLHLGIALTFDQGSRVHGRVSVRL
jgi:hypothetical protein